MIIFGRRANRAHIRCWNSQRTRLLYRAIQKVDVSALQGGLWYIFLACQCFYSANNLVCWLVYAVVFVQSTISAIEVQTPPTAFAMQSDFLSLTLCGLRVCIPLRWKLTTDTWFAECCLAARPIKREQHTYGLLFTCRGDLDNPRTYWWTFVEAIVPVLFVDASQNSWVSKNRTHIVYHAFLRASLVVNGLTAGRKRFFEPDDICSR